MSAQQLKAVFLTSANSLSKNVRVLAVVIDDLVAEGKPKVVDYNIRTDQQVWSQGTRWLGDELEKLRDEYFPERKRTK